MEYSKDKGVMDRLNKVDRGVMKQNMLLYSPDCNNMTELQRASC